MHCQKILLSLIAMFLLSQCRHVDSAASQSQGINDRLQNVKTNARDGLQKSLFAAYALKSGIITSLYAKNVCSCLFVAKLPLATCKRLGAQYGSDWIVSASPDAADPSQPLKVRHVASEGRISGLFYSEKTRSPINPRAVARFDPAKPQLGCVLEYQE